MTLAPIWNSNQIPIATPQTLISTGIGLRWQRDPILSFRLDWGIPLNPIDRQGNTLQDNGIYFSIRIQPF
ncbi:hypothetical protein K9N68_14120 [Kovacikia minuta CCNUW1]|uniref:hypothetical protein n=1 Tax=Kovacikia minuta TaxID=2931930 RepID=UPI001CCF5697|nr:hypothetical protein [Kovacikia minuta]UBF28871.1 hypothetical protein K9N68_14120 [Kovacikia minuta CCNUW1]